MLTYLRREEDGQRSTVLFCNFIRAITNLAHINLKNKR